MHRFFVSPENVGEREIHIVGDDVNHIKNVLRMKTGQKLLATCGRGSDYECSINRFLEDEIILSIEKEMASITELPVDIVLFQALPKLDKMDLIIQKAVELGAKKIYPIETRRCIVKLDEKKKAKRNERWNKISQAAAKQSGRGVIPQVEEVLSFKKALEIAKDIDIAIIPYEMFTDMKESVKNIKLAAKKKSIAIFIGPEGGFERGEIQEAIEAGVIPVSLGKRILRTETAGLAILSMLMFLIEGENID